MGSNEDSSGVPRRDGKISWQVWRKNHKSSLREKIDVLQRNLKERGLVTPVCMDSKDSVSAKYIFRFTGLNSDFRMCHATGLFNNILCAVNEEII
jgi:hypothetical protein